MHFVMEGLRLVSINWIKVFIYVKQQKKTKIWLLFYKFKGWIDELLELTWKACEDTDVILESPSAMVGIHMAEKLRK